MYGARCQNLESLANHFQQLLINKLLEESLAREVELKIGDIFYTAIRRVSNIFKIIHPTFLRKVRFISLELEPWEQAADTARRLDKLAELAELDNISAQELKLMKFCSLTTDGELKQKICELQDKSWENVKECIRTYNTARGMDSQFFTRKEDKLHIISLGTGQRPRESSKEK